MTVSRLRAAFSKPLFPVVFFFSGVTFDSFTLTRIDSLLDNLGLLLYLSLLGALIILTARMDTRMGVEAPPTGLGGVPGLVARAQPYYPHAIQFLLGGLYSAYTIFYLQSASLTATAVFFGVLVALLVGNEFLHDRLSNLRLLVSLYALVVLSFFTFFLPVLTGFMNTWVFLVGAGLSAAVTLKVVELIYQGRPTASRWEPVLSVLPAIGLIGLLVGFYFLNWIPPVPLSMKFGGSITKSRKPTEPISWLSKRETGTSTGNARMIPFGEPAPCIALPPCSRPSIYTRRSTIAGSTGPQPAGTSRRRTESPWRSRAGAKGAIAATQSSNA